jgi:orotidine-5'-phosphate decarboxylase
MMETTRHDANGEVRRAARDPRERVIVALDVAGAGEVETLVSQLEGEARWFKVGLELYSALGAWAVRFLTGRSLHVMLDLKLHDIPRTVERAVRAQSASGVELLTVHASGGREMIARAVTAAGKRARDDGLHRTRVLAVTVLTSLDDADAHAIYGVERAADRVLSLACLAREAGADGVVASPQEAETIRAALGPDFLIVTPGIRAATSEGDDQKRTSTPIEAARVADFLVVGRPVTKASDPRAAFRDLVRSL